MTNADLWVDLRGPIRKVIAGGYDRDALDKQLELTFVRYKELEKEDKRPKLPRAPDLKADATTLETATTTISHPADDLEESSSSVPTDLTQAMEPRISVGPILDPKRPPSPTGVGGDRDDPTGAFDSLYD